MDGRTDVNMRDGKTGEKVMRNQNQGEIFTYTTLGRLLLACCHTAGKERKKKQHHRPHGHSHCEIPQTLPFFHSTTPQFYS